MFIIPPPSLASSFQIGRNFSKGVRFSNKISQKWPFKKTCQHILHQITTPPRSPHLDHDQDRLRFRYILSMMTRRIHEWWNSRSNKCVRTNKCKKSVFVVIVRNINICGRILTQFTGLLRTNTVAAKRHLLAERTGLGKSVSVWLRDKNGPICEQVYSTKEFIYSFRSTVFVPMEFQNISRPKLNKTVTWVVRLSV